MLSNYLMTSDISCFIVRHVFLSKHTHFCFLATWFFWLLGPESYVWLMTYFIFQFGCYIVFFQCLSTVYLSLSLRVSLLNWMFLIFPSSSFTLRLLPSLFPSLPLSHNIHLFPASIFASVYRSFTPTLPPHPSLLMSLSFAFLSLGWRYK